MVKRLFVQGLSSYTTQSTVQKYFEQFGTLYECVVPPPPKYSVIDFGPDSEEIETRSSIRYESAGELEILDDDLGVEPYNIEKHKTFEDYMKKVGDGDAFVKEQSKTCAGYAYITFVDTEGYTKCMKSDVHDIDRVKCTVELAKNEEGTKLKIESKRLFVSFFPLDRLTAKELKETFGAYGKITDVEFVSDSDGPLHFCIITFADPRSVDVILSKPIYIRDVLIFTRRAVLKESIKIAEHKIKEQGHQQQIQLPQNHTAYPTPSNPVTVVPASSSSSHHLRYDPSAAAGYAPLHQQERSSDADPYSHYGYGPRKW